MSWLEPVSTVVTGASLAADVAKRSDAIFKFVKKCAYQARYGKVLLPVFGAGGVGKSTIGSVLSKGSSVPFSAYRESRENASFELSGKFPGSALVVPGQINRVERYWPDAFNKVNSGKALGVVNVVSYGYHSFSGMSYREHDGYVEGMGKSDFIGKYIEARRLVELELLKRLIDGLSPVKRAFFMVTVISKQDLWWADRERVKSHYIDGEYDRIVSRLRDRVGHGNFQHEYVPCSLMHSNFIAGPREVLKDVSSGYDLALHESYLSGFVSSISGIALSHQGVKL